MELNNNNTGNSQSKEDVNYSKKSSKINLKSTVNIKFYLRKK